jgi:hypothetical protein
MGEAEAAARSHAWRNLLSHLSAAGETARLFELLETKPFLADQVEGLRGFQASGDDLENHALPAAIAARDWQRFLHYAAVALNLRGLAEDLAAPEILRALARAGRADLALDAAGRLPDPFGQVQALAAVASGCEDGPARQAVLRELEGRLDDLARETDRQASFAGALAAVARDTGPDLQGRWPGWIDRLAPGQAAQVWRAIAEGWMQRHNPYEAELWQALEAIGEPSQILAFAPAGLGAMDLETPGEILQRLEALLPDPRDRRYAGATLLGRFALRHPERACAAWEAWSTRLPLVWSTELIERGREVLGRLTPQHIEEIAASIDDSRARAELRVVVLEARRSSEAASPALAELRSVPDGPGKLHWILRYLTARPAGPQDEVRRQIIAVGRHLHAIGFTAEVRDLARWLDLVALHLPDQIRAQLDAVLWSPELTAERVCALADAVTHPGILYLLIERAEPCAAAVSPTEAEGFKLRKNLLTRATCRHCVLTESLETLQSVAERLLPEEEDELCMILAPRLAALSEKGSNLAKEVCDKIGNRHLRLVTLLRSQPAIPSEVLAPASLYAALARIEILQDECHGLKALLETPADPRELIRRIVLPIRDPRIRTRALLRLARHALAFEIACHDRPDHLAPLELVRWLITTETDEELASLTPEIAALGAGAGGSRAIAEVQEAARQLAALETVDWPVRREALKDLLARMAGGDLLPAKAIAAVLLTLLRLPKQLRPETARQQLRQHWPEILPLIAATADRLPEKHLGPVRRALQESRREFGGDATSAAGDPKETEADVWHRPEQIHEAEWSERIALRVADTAPDPSDPCVEPLLASLWETPDISRPALAWAVRDALRRGRPHGEAVLRIWLHAHLAPSPGRGRPQGRDDVAGTEKALGCALRLGPERSSP